MTETEIRAKLDEGIDAINALTHNDLYGLLAEDDTPEFETECYKENAINTLFSNTADELNMDIELLEKIYTKG